MAGWATFAVLSILAAGPSVLARFEPAAALPGQRVDLILTIEPPAGWSDAADASSPMDLSIGSVEGLSREGAPFPSGPSGDSGDQPLPGVYRQAITIAAGRSPGRVQIDGRVDLRFVERSSGRALRLRQFPFAASLDVRAEAPAPITPPPTGHDSRQLSLSSDVLGSTTLTPETPGDESPAPIVPIMGSPARDVEVGVSAATEVVVDEFHSEAPIEGATAPVRRPWKTLLVVAALAAVATLGARRLR